MGTVYKSGVSYEQQRDQLQAQETELAIKDLKDSLKNEANTRANDDATLRQDITALHGVVTAEIESRTETQSQIQADLLTETNQRQAAINELQTAIDAEKAAREADNTGTQGDISALQDRLDTEETARKNADTILQTNLTNAQNTLSTAINAEKSAREAADTQLQTALNSAIATETQNRTNALNALDTNLKAYVDGEISNVAESLNDFTAPTLEEAGERGIVPQPPKGMLNGILTTRGWRTPDEAGFTISSVPSQVGTVTYNGAAQSPTWLNFDNKKLKIEGATSGTNAQSYTVTFTPLDIYVWEDTLDQSPKTATWKIDALKLAKPTASVTEFTYNNAAQGITVSNYDSAYINQSGTTSSTNAGNYSAVYKLKNTSNTKWSDNSVADVTINWKINVLKLEKPTAAVTEFMQTDDAQTLEVVNYNSTYINQTGTTTATAAGDYSVTYSLKSATNTAWKDNSVADIVINWTIKPRNFAKPVATSDTEFTYDGAAKSVTVSNYDSNYMTRTGSTSETAAGNYQVVYSLKDKTKTRWIDDSTDDVVISWKINKRTFTKPAPEVTEFTFNNANQDIAVPSFNANYMIRTGDGAQKSNGEYQTTFILKYPENTAWEDSSVENVTINWKINKLVLPKPTAATTTFTFSAGSSAPSSKTLSVENYNSAYMLRSGTVKESSVGNYSVNYSLLYPTDSYWEDSSTADVTIDWSIEKLVLTKPHPSTTTWEYTSNTTGSTLGRGRKPANSTYDGYYMIRTGDYEEKRDVGEYQINFELKYPNDTCWEDSSNTDYILNWSITPKIITKPYATSETNLTFKRTSSIKSQSVDIANYKKADMTATGADSDGNTKAQYYVGNYQAVFSLISPVNRIWEDGSVEPVVIDWSIGVLKIPKPTAAETEFTYTIDTGSAVKYTPPVENYNKYYMTRSGNTGLKYTAGEYSITYTLLNPGQITWEDDSVEDVVIDWKINKRVLQKPTAAVTEFDFDGTAKTLDVENVDGDHLKVSGTASATNVGVYSVIYTPRNSNICWSDESSDPVTITWEIKKASLAADAAQFKQAEPLTYNGNTQTVTITNFDANLYTITGNSDYRAGVYNALITPKSGYTWQDGSTDSISVQWEILPLAVNRPTITPTAFFYDGTAKTVEISGFDSATMRQAGKTSATESGEYEITFSLVNSNYCWEDSATDNYVVEWHISGTPIPKPTASVTEFTYDGTPKTLSLENFDAANMTVEDNEFTDAGDYQAVISLKNPAHACWADGSENDIVISWKINRKRLTTAQSTFAIQGTYTFNAEEQSPVISGFDSSVHILWLNGQFYTDISDISEATRFNAGTYNIMINTKGNYAFSDGSISTYEMMGGYMQWTIQPRVLPKPTLTKTRLTWEAGVNPEPPINNIDTKYMAVRSEATLKDSGFEYVTTVIPKYKEDFFHGDCVVWQDSTASDVVLTWYLDRKQLTSAQTNLSVSGTYTYNKNYQTPNIPNFSDDLHQIIYNGKRLVSISELKERNAGTYTFKIVPRDYYSWYGNSSNIAEKTFNWTIQPLKIAKPVLKKGEFSYDGNYHKVDITYDLTTEYYSWNSGSIFEARDAGSYHVEFVLNNGLYLDSNQRDVCWTDGSFDNVVINWSIGLSKVTKPTLSPTSFTYDGKTKTPTINNLNTNIMLVSGVRSAEGVGNYAIEIGLIDRASTCWSDNSVDNLILNWSITGQKLSSSQSTFSQAGTLTYNGGVQAVSINNYNSSVHTLSGDTTATNAGGYVAKVLPAANYAFYDGSTEKDVNWAIQPLRLAKPTAATTEFVYDNTTKTLTVDGYNTTYMTRSGTVSASAINNYSVTYSLKNTTNTTWADGSTDTVVINWSIGLTKVTAPTISTGTFTYDGNSKTPTFSGFDSTYMTMSSDTSAVNAGNYVIKVALKDKTRYCWQDNSIDDLTFSWIINRKKLTSTQSTFSQSGTLNYTGSSQNVTITNYDANYHSLGGVYLSTNAGTFVAKVSPLANYAFSDGTTAAKSVTWTINPIKLAKPTASVTSFAYDKQAHALTIFNYNSSYINQSGTVSATAAGSYSVSFSLKNKTNTTWADSTTGNVIISWSIDKTRLTKPTLATSTFTYNGSNKTVSVQNFNGTYCTQSGVTQAINAGNYSVTISLNDNTLVEWEDASTADVVLSWTIDKAVISSTYSNPSQKTIPAYTGNAINLLSTTYLNGYSSTYQTWSGVTSSTNAGTFTAYVEPKENYTFNDGTTAKKAVTLQIGKAIITPPEISTTTTLTYTGAAQSPTLTGYDANKMTLGSDTSKINAGEYTLTVTPKNSNYVFSTGESAVSLIWSIAPNTLYQDFKFTADVGIFNGETQNNAITKLQLPNGSYVDYDSSLFTSSGTLSASNTGVYPVTLTFKDSNYIWGANNNKSLTKNWEIKPCNTVAYPRSQNFTYDGNEHAPYNVATSKFIKVVSGTASASAVGNYTVTYGLKYPAQTSWYQSGGNTDNYTINWSIGMTSITAPTISTNYFDYNGSAKSVTISGFDSNKMTKTGTESATAKGFYTVTISLKDKTGSCWSTGGNADLVIEWAIGKKRVAKPTLADNAVTEFEYSGSAKTLSVEGYDANTMTQSGYLSATDAGDYTVSYALKTTTACTYVWQDNSTSKVSFSWKINKKALSAVTFSQSGTLTYDGTAKTVTIKNFNTSTMDISSDTSKADAGSYTAKITPKANYTWSDGTVTAKSVSWKIKPKTLTKPTASTTNFDYDGTAKTLSISNYNSTYINQTGTISATNAGSYSAIFALKSSTNTIWADSTTDNVVIAWSIGGNYIAVPTISPKSQTSQGLTKTHSVTVTGFDSNTMTQSGTVSANGAAKKYTVTFSLKDKTNTAWVGGGTADKSLNWWVDIRTLTSANSTFTQTTSITCDGNSHSVTEAIGGIKSSYIGEYYTLSGDTTATAAGTYTVTITPTAAAQWSDKTSTAKTVQWTIDGAETNLQLEKTAYTASIPVTNGTYYLYNEIVTTTTTASPKITVKFTTNSDGDITFTSDDNLVVRHSSRIANTSSGTVAASAGQFTLYPVANGTATITVTQKATSSFNAVTKYLTVTVTAGTILLNWSEIQTLAKNGNLLNYMRIGDVTSAIHLEGTVGTASVSGYKQYKLIGYNHNSGVEGTGKAHFMQLDVLTDSKYGTSADTTANDFVFYYYSNPNGGRGYYGNATIRNRCTEYFNLLPSALQNVIVACKKYSYFNGYNYVSDKIWIPSAYELVGSNTGVVPVNNGYIEQYEYFANGNSRAFDKNYWTRDVTSDSTDGQALYINTSGSVGKTNTQKLSYGFLPCFTIG